MEDPIQIVSVTFTDVLKQTITLFGAQIELGESDLFCGTKGNEIKLLVRISDVVQHISVTLFHENKTKPFTIVVVGHSEFQKPRLEENTCWFSPEGTEFTIEFLTKEKSKDGNTVKKGAKPFRLEINAYVMHSPPNVTNVGRAEFKFHTNTRTNKRSKSQKEGEVASSDYCTSSPVPSNENNWDALFYSNQPQLETPPSTSDPYEHDVHILAPLSLSFEVVNYVIRAEDKDIRSHIQASFSVASTIPSTEVAEKLLPVLGNDATSTIVEYILDPLGTQKISAEAMSHFFKNFGFERDEWLLWVNELDKLKPYKYFHGIVVNDETFDEKHLSSNKCFYIRLSNTRLHTIVWTVFEDGEPNRTPVSWNKHLGSRGWRKENEFTMEQTHDELLNQIPINKRENFLAKKPKYNKNL